MASAFPSPGVRRDSAATSREAVFPFGILPADCSSALRWTGKEAAASLTQARAVHRKKQDYRCTSALDPVPHMAHKLRTQSTFLPACVLRRPVTTYSKQVPSLPAVQRAFHVPVDPSVVSPPAALQTPAVAAPLQLRRPSLQLPSPLPNGIPLRRTVNSCFEHYKILESVGSGTYANVWKVQKLPVSRFYNGMSLAPSELLPQSKHAAVMGHLSASPLQNICTATFAKERDESSAVSNALQWQRPPHPSTASLPEGCQQQLVSCRSNSTCRTNDGDSCGTAPAFEGRQLCEGRSPVEGQIYAAKLLQLDRFSSDTLPRVLDMFSKEIANLAACQCPGVVRLHEVVEGKEGWLLVQDYIDGGTIWCEDVCTDEDEAFLHFIQLLQAVLYLQENNVLHRDLKPTNILRWKQSKRIVIADFGWSERLDCCRITPMEWPGTLEINPPEIINGTGPLTNRLDNYAVGMTLLLFLSSRFVCRQKGLDAATAAPYVLRTVHELRRGSPPAVFKGSGDAWTLFLGLTAPHPSRRWSLDHALAHTWVHQKLLQLGEKAFIWHPRVLQLTIGLQCAYGKSVRGGESERSDTGRRGERAPRGCIAIPVSSCNFESSVKMLPGSGATRSNVLWMPNRRPSGSRVSSACAPPSTLQTTKRLSAPVGAERATTTAASVVQAARMPSGHNTYARGAYCEQCHRGDGVVPREWHATGSEQEAQMTHLAQQLHGASHLTVPVTSPHVKPSPLPFAPHHVPPKGLHGEQGSSCSRRQSMSICSTTDSFMTNLSFQQQHASQHSSGGHLRTQTASSLLDPKYHVERTTAEGIDWQAPLPCTVNTSAESLDNRVSQDSERANLLQRSITYANDSEVYPRDQPHQYQHRYQLDEMALANGLTHQLHYACENADKSYESSDVTAEWHVPHTLVGSRGLLLRRQGNADTAQVLPVRGGQQLAPLTPLHQHRPLPRQVLLTELRGAEHSMTSISAREMVAKRRTGPPCLPLPSSNHGSQKALPASNCHTGNFTINNKSAVSPDPLPVPVAQRTDLKAYDKTCMRRSSSGKAETVESYLCTRQEGLFARFYDKTDALQPTPLNLPGRTTLAPLDETVIEEDDNNDVDSSLSALHVRQLSSQAEGPTAEDDMVYRKALHSKKIALQYGRAAIVPPLYSADTTLHPSPVEGEALQRSTEHMWRHDISSFWNPHVTNVLGSDKYHISTSTTSTCNRAASHGQVSTFATKCLPRDSDVSLPRTAAKITKLQCEEQHLPMSAFASNTACQASHQSLKAPLSFAAAPRQDDCVSSPVATTHGSASSISPYRRRGGSLTLAGRCNEELLSMEISKAKAMYTALHDPPSKLSPSCKDAADLATEEEGRLERPPVPSTHGRIDHEGLALELDAPILSRSPALRRLPSHLSAVPFENGCESSEMPIHRKKTAKGATGGILQGESSPKPRPVPPALQLLPSTTVGRVNEKSPAFLVNSLSSPGTAVAAASITNDELVNAPWVAADVQRSDYDITKDHTQRRQTSPALSTTLSREPAGVSNAWWGIFSREERGSRRSDEPLCRESENTPTVKSQLVISTSTAVPSPVLGSFLLPADSCLVRGAPTLHSNSNVDSDDKPGDKRQDDSSTLMRRDSKCASFQEHQDSSVLPSSGGLYEEGPQNVVSEVRSQGHAPERHSLRDAKVNPSSDVSLDVNYQANAFQRYDSHEEAPSSTSQRQEGILSIGANHVTQSSSKAATTDVGEGTTTATCLKSKKVGEELFKKPEKAGDSSPSQEFVSPAVESLHISSWSNRKLSTVALEQSPIAFHVTRVAGSVDSRMPPESGTRPRESSSLPSRETEAARIFRCSRAGSQTSTKITGKLKFHANPQCPSSTLFLSTRTSCENAQGMDEIEGHALLPRAPLQQHNSKAEQRLWNLKTLQGSFRADESSREFFNERMGEDRLTGTAISQKSPGMGQADITHPKYSAQKTSRSTPKSCLLAECTLMDEYSEKRHRTREEIEPNKGQSSFASIQTSIPSSAEVKGVGIGIDETEKPMIFTPCAAAEGKPYKGGKNLIYLNTCPELSRTQEHIDLGNQKPQPQYVDRTKQSTGEQGFFYHTFPIGGNKDDQTNCYANRVLTVPGQRAASFPMTITTIYTRIHDITVQAETTFLCGKQQSRRSSLTRSAVLGDKRYLNNSAFEQCLRFNSEPVAPRWLD